MTTAARPPLRDAEYHAFEIALCGFSGAGKTTLGRKIIAALQPKYKIGFVKSDAHKFDFDTEGKDTDQMWRAGAEQVSIFDHTHLGIIQRGGWDMVHRRTQFENCDFVLVEGRKRSPLPKIVMLGGRDDILPLVQSGEIANVLAFVGAEAVGPTGFAQAYFQRDQVDAIADFILRQWRERIAPLRGLVLTGGESRRMQQDKALLKFNGQTQLTRAVELLRPYVDEVYVSTRPGQRGSEQTLGTPVIEDRLHGFGPLGGIASALLAHPTSAWLVVACDLPFLNTLTLNKLIESRAPMRFATAFQSSGDEMPEPLCAIYEPRAISRLMQFVGLGYNCPRKLLMNSHINLLQLPDPAALTNMNSPEDLARARQIMGDHA